jgi:hypothetical protein
VNSDGKIDERDLEESLNKVSFLIYLISGDD